MSDITCLSSSFSRGGLAPEETTRQWAVEQLCGAVALSGKEPAVYTAAVHFLIAHAFFTQVLIQCLKSYKQCKIYLSNNLIAMAMQLACLGWA